METHCARLSAVRLAATLLLTLSMPCASSADEGMWMLSNLDERTMDVMRELGLTLTRDELYSTNHASLKDAVADFGDYCSGVVVSPEGLLFTNHHCGMACVQKLSTPQRNILRDGFVARGREEELPCEGLFARFLERTADCTQRVLAGMQGLPQSKLDSVLTGIEEEYTQAFPDRYCTVKPFFGAGKFYVSIYKVYTDVRLVLVCPQSLGSFGGDTDNWMWPRQTCDFSVFRIYADPHGNPADFSADNLPLATPAHATVSVEGYQPGDFCMTIGFPGSTSRYLSSHGVRERMETANASMIDVRGKKQEVWSRHMRQDSVTALKYAAKYAASSNYWKNSIGMNRAIANLHVVEEKQRKEQALALWWLADERLQSRFGMVEKELAQAYADIHDDMLAQAFFNETFNRGIELRTPAKTLSDLPPDADSTETAAARDMLLAFYKDYDPETDREVMAALLDNYRQRTGGRRLPAFYGTIDTDFNGDCAAYADNLFATTALTSFASADSLLTLATADSDPAVAYHRALEDTATDMAADMASALETIRDNEQLLTQAVLEREQDTPHYSDANFTMRLSYGFVQDYTSGGMRYPYYTTPSSLLSKVAMQDTIADYRLSADLARLMGASRFGRYTDRRTGDLHLCFLSNNDITGGNSGSPMFNGKGELMGLAFDGNWESMSGDISFDPDLQRCIGVDIRFVLFIIDRWAKADNIIRELGL